MVSQLIAIDSRLRNHQFVIDQIAAGFAVLELDSNRDGLDHIADYLSSRSSANAGEVFGAIHLLSHGSEGVVQFGSLTLKSANLAAKAQTLARIHSLLAPGADLLVYGCDVAQGARGNAFVTQLAKISGLDVAASTNLTGGKTGDWMLETTVGQLQAQALRLNLEDSLLAGQTINGTSGNDTLNGTAGNDTINGLGGDDWIDVGNTTFGSDTVNGGSGADWISFSKLSSVSLNVNLADHTATSNLGSVALTSIEKVAGTSGADSLTGGEQADKTDAIGNRVTEWLRGNGGNDTLTGGEGADFSTAADYSNNTSGQAVNANLRTGVAVDGLSGTDKLVNIDFLVGGAGNDSLTGGSLSRDPSGNFLEIFRGNAGNDRLDGSNASSDGDFASVDRADYSRNTSAQAINVNLASGQASDGMGGTDTLISIDHVFGGAGNDTFIGGSGGETFDGGAGNDSMDGGAGSDQVRFQQSTAGVVVNLSAASLTAAGKTVAANSAYDGTGGTDTLISIENVRGSDYSDYIRGSDETPIRQFFSGDAGSDTIDGGLGVDIVGYGDTPLLLGGITASLVAGPDGVVRINDKKGGIDTLINIEGLSGSNSADSLTGSSGSDYLRGQGGSDTLDGSTGEDWVLYNVDPGSVTINLQTGQATDGWNGANGLLALGGTDTLKNIENAEGSDFNDSITGSSGDNQLVGRLGNDTLLGGAGRDTLDGGLGNDTLDGGAITDTLNLDDLNIASYSSASGAVAVSLEAGTSSGAAGNDVLRNINMVIGSASTDTLTGSNRTEFAEFFEGGASDDTIDGLGGNFDVAMFSSATGGVTANLATGIATGAGIGTDTLRNVEALFGSNFADSLTGGASSTMASELFRGNAGNDTIDGGSGNDWAFYDTGVTSVVVTLGDSVDGTASDGLGGTDVLRWIEGVRGSAFGDTLTGSNRTDSTETLEGREGNDVIDGKGGLDTAWYKNSRSGVNVDLSQSKAINDGYGTSDTLTNIENVYGSRDFNDLIKGDAGDNRLEGNGGNDTLMGGAGEDYILGGTGDDSIDGGTNTAPHSYDWASYDAATGAVQVNLSSGKSAGADGIDTLTGIEAVSGSSVADTLTGDANTNILRGNGGNDTIDGGDGFDIASYYRASGGVSVSLLTNTSSGADGADTLIRIEGISGSQHNDTLTGNANENWIGGNAGDDSMVGGTGIDTANYHRASGGVTVNLTTGRANGADGNDTLDGFENIAGSLLYADSLTGNEGNNLIEGNGGNDTLNGGAGQDTLQGSDGQDYVEGGLGNDALDGGANDTVLGFDWVGYQNASGAVQVNLATGLATGADGNDTLASFDAAAGSTYADLLTGNSAVNVLRGNGGNDTLDGGAGFDHADYSKATDSVTVSLVSNTSSGFDGVDTLISIEGIRGGQTGDTLTGDANDNWIRGNGGNDSLDGGAGIDTTDYYLATGGVTINLGNGTSSGADGSDTLTGFENLRGSFLYDDNLAGDSSNNKIEGMGGNDTLVGAGGSDTLLGGDGSDTLLGGDGQDYVEGGLGNDVLNGGANDTVFGFDWVGYQDATGAVQVNLATGLATGADGNDTLTSFDAAAGGAYADRLTGDGAIINVLRGNGGNDTLDGGAGFDYADYSKATGSVTVSLASNISSGSDGIDTLISIEGLRGGQAGDTLTGDAYDNWIRGNGGNDSLNAGAGIDTADYYLATGGVNVSLGNTTLDGVSSGADGNDTLRNFENINGSFLYNDSLTGNDGNNSIQGLGGNDTLNGGAGQDTLLGGDGRDTLDGGAGNDTLDGGTNRNNVSYSGATTGVIVNLITGTASDGQGGTDTLININQVEGTAFEDQITVGVGGFAAGNGGDDLLTAGFINDSYSMGGAFNGGTGNDTIVGSVNGSDLASYSMGARVDGATVAVNGAAWTIGRSGSNLLGLSYDASSTTWTITDLRTSATTSDPNLGTDSLQNIGIIHINGVDGAGANLALYFSLSVSNGVGKVAPLSLIVNGSDTEANDSLTGTDGPDLMLGFGGNDTLLGNAGDDTMMGGNNDDLLSGGTGNDFLDGGAGNDTLDGAYGNDVLRGGDGDDILRISDGIDTMDGGAGTDTLYAYGGNYLLTGATLTGDANTGWTLTAGTLTAGGTGVVMGLFKPNLGTGTWTAQSPGQTSPALISNIEQLQVQGVDAGGQKMVISFAVANSLTAPMITRIGTNLQGTQGDDSLLGTESSDTINAFTGSDSITALGGNDQIFIADDGSTDTIDGGDGNDTLTLRVDGSAFTLGSNDNIRGVENFSLDTISLASNAVQSVTVSDSVFAAAGASNISVEAWNSNVAVNFNASAVLATHSVSLRANDGNDTLIGGAGDDYLWDSGGNDSLMGGDGDDTLHVGGENNTVDGGAGMDTLWGDLGELSLAGATLVGSVSTGWSVFLSTGLVLGQIKPLLGTGTWTLQPTGETAVTRIKNIELIQINGVDATGSPMTFEISVNNSLTAPTLTIANRAPTAVADVAVATEAGGVSNGKVGVNPGGNVLTNDTDPDTVDTKTVFNIKAGVLTTTTATVVASGTTNATGKAVSGTYGGLKIGADGSYVYTVDNTNATVNELNSGSTPLTDTFTYSVKDAAGLSSSTTLTVTINGANDAPVNTLPTATPSTLEDTSKAITGLKIKDVDAGSASFAVTLAAANGTLSLGSATGVTVASNNSASVKLTGTLAAINSLLSASNAVTYTPKANFNGSTSLTMTTDDGSGGTDTDTLAMKVTPVNDAPTGAVTISGNAVLKGVLSASNTLADVDLMGNLVYQWLSDGTAISGATASTFTMLAAQVNHSVSLKLSYTDGGGTRESVTSGILRVGSSGADTISGLSGADTIDGGSGADSISGGDGNDFLTGGKGNDTLDGGAGTDTASYASASAAVTVNLAASTSTGTASSSAANDVAAIGVDTLKNLENIIGGGFGDKITGDANANVLCGKLGNDTLTGGAGADVFVLDTATGSGNVDTITDFTSASDKIQLSKSIFTAAGSLGDLASAAFWSGAGVVKGHDATDRFVYNKTNGNLYYDADGNGTVAAVLIATLGVTTYPTLLYSDLQIIG